MIGADRRWVPVLRLALLCLVIVSVAMLTFWSSIWMRYGRLDDYVYIQKTRLDYLASYYVPFNLDMGRPIPGWLTGGILPGADTVAELGRLRAIVTFLLALSGCAAAALTLQLTRSTGGWVRYVAALGVGLTPLALTASPSTVTWAVLMGALHALTTAMLAGMLAAWTHRLWWIPSGALLLVTAFSYQQFVPVAVLPAALLSASAFARREAPRWWRPVVVGVMGVVSLALNAAMIVARDGGGAGRIGTGTWTERINWYVHSFMPVVFDLHVPATSDGALSSGVLALALICTPLLLGVRHAVVPAAVIVATAGCAAAVLPLEMWASYRVASPTQFCLWVGAAACVAYTVSHLSWRVVSWAGLAGGLVLVGVALQTAHMRAEDYIAEPNARDWANVLCATGGRDAPPMDTRWYVSPWDATTSPVVVGDEYGVIASAVTWSLQAQIWIAEDVTNGPGLPDPKDWLPDVLPPAAVPEEGRTVFPVDACAR